MSRVSRQNRDIEQIYQRIKEVLTNARSRAWQAVNTALKVLKGYSRLAGRGGE